MLLILLSADQKYFLAFLNSSLHNYVYQYLSAEQGKTLAQVKIGLLEVLPFKHSSRDEAEVVNLVDAIIDASIDGMEPRACVDSAASCPAAPAHAPWRTPAKS